MANQVQSCCFQSQFRVLKVSIPVYGRSNKVTLSMIFNAVCEHFSLTKEQLKSKRQTNDLAFARQLFCLLAREQTSRSTIVIGKEINRDHSTVIYSEQHFKEQKAIYKEYKAAYDKVKYFLLEELNKSTLPS